MTTTFDRYLLTRYLQVFVILFVSVFGLFTVIDGFTNVDEFQQNSKGAAEVVLRMASFYAYKSSLFLDMAGPILTVIGAMVVFALLQRNSELHPILAAGVPTRRLLLPIVIGALLVNGAMAANQELIIPRIAHILQAPRDAVERGSVEVDPLTDHLTGIFIAGKELSLAPPRIIKAEFVLPSPRIARRITSVLAEEAAYLPQEKSRPGGWLLKNTQKSFGDLALTEEGRTRILALENPRNLFVVSEVSFDQLYNRMQSHKLLSTAELIRRLRNTAFQEGTMPELALHLHARLVRPFANLLFVLLAVPLILRKESRGLVTNMAVCTAILATLLGFSEVAAYLGKLGTLTPQLAAWLPILGCGTLAAWLSGLTQT